MKKILLLIGLTIIVSTVMIGCSSAKKNYQEGNKFFLEGNYEEAEVKFKEALRLNSNRAEYFIHYGMTLIQLGQYQEAINQFDLAYQEKQIEIILANNKQIKRGKGIAYYHMAEYEKALEMFDEALKMKELPDLNMDILFYKGQTLGMLDRFEEAEEAYTDLLSKDKENHSALYQRGHLYRLAGAYDKSLADYELAITLSPNEYEYYLGKYFIYTDMGNEFEANNVLEQMEQLEVKTSQDEYNLAKTYFYQGNKEMALSKLNESIEKGFPEAYFYMGEVYQANKEYETAIYHYNMYLETGAKNSGTIYNQIASCLMKLENYKEALTYLEMGLSLHHGEVWKVLKRNEVISYEKLGLFEQALEKLQEFLKVYPEEEDAKRELEFLQIQLR